MTEAGRLRQLLASAIENNSTNVNNAILAEREACAKIAERYHLERPEKRDAPLIMKEIRARGDWKKTI